MASVIRLRRIGRKNRPTYRIVVAEESCPRDGRFIETIGHYNPIAAGKGDIEINKDRAEYWIQQGVRISDTVRTIFKTSSVRSLIMPSGESSAKATGAAKIAHKAKKIKVKGAKRRFILISS